MGGFGRGGCRGGGWGGEGVGEEGGEGRVEVGEGGGKGGWLQVGRMGLGRKMSAEQMYIQYMGEHSLLEKNCSSTEFLL